MPPWEPGQSGNPKGRPKGSGIRHYIRKLADEVPEDGSTKGLTRGQWLAKDVWDEAKARKNKWARQVCMEQTDGKQVQPLQVEPLKVHFTFTDTDGEKNETEEEPP